MQKMLAWAVHIFTASAACVGLLTLVNLYEHQYRQALWCIIITVIIDAIDGTFARLTKVKEILPNVDGTLLDNLVDYLNYVITPCFFLYVKEDLLPPSVRGIVITIIIITSSYQFCQKDAKTPDHFFKGFPCYWNIAVFYMFLLHTNSYLNAFVLLACAALIFVPVKYVYPSRLDYLFESKQLKILMHIFSVVYTISSGMMLWEYPDLNPIYLFLSLGYIVVYFSLSIYKTWASQFSARIPIF